ncbi:dTDP-glucose 4,6-dehydratase [Longirhabdus pacifica]|uniref:dTDP-glucose 4,6-dehydratase n=1 Tax=Longirhabdus pacifica TaxID=2305227 RepID=UPI001008DD75|nr:dTDP-glucose 4,6-dehydratase [Longirhabdus pacifica]
MRVLVTGGAGFIGSHFVRHACEQDEYELVVNLDKLTYAGDMFNLKQVEKNEKHIFVHGDICDGTLVKKLIQTYQLQYIVHFAAESHVDRSIEASDAFIQTNCVGTQTLLHAARDGQIEKFVHISTDEVYGSIDKGHFTEESPLVPSSPYSASKASSDLLVQAFHTTFDLPINITRCTNNYGPNQYPEKLIPLMILRAVNNQPLPIYGDGSNIRDWIHVDDHIKAVDLVLRRGANGHTYNVGGNNEWTNISIATNILNIIGKEPSLITYVEDRKGHDFRYAIDDKKIRALGWNVQYDFKEGLKQTIEWYIQNQGHYQLTLH